ncbi:MAG: SRPBCC family protein [Aeromicrobium sp.]
MERTIVIKAGPDTVLDVITDFDSYPVWQKQVANCEVHERDDEGRPILVTITTTAMGMTIPAPVKVSYGSGEMEYHLVEPSGVAVQQDAYYALHAVSDVETELRLQMQVDLKWNLPAIMLSQLATKGVNENLKAVKQVAERRVAEAAGSQQ